MEYRVELRTVTSPDEVRIEDDPVRKGLDYHFRMTQDSGFVTYIFFKETDDTVGKVGYARIYEVDPNKQIACFISEGKRIQWNDSFWDNFLLKPDGLYI